MARVRTLQPGRVDRAARELGLHDERWDDAAFATTCELTHLERLAVWNQPITYLPTGLGKAGGLRELALGKLRNLTSIDAIAQIQTLERVVLYDVPLELPRVFAALAELPELTELTLGGRGLLELPAGISKLPSLIRLELVDCAKLDLGGACKHLGEIASLRQLVVVSTLDLASACRPLGAIAEAQMHEFSPRRRRWNLGDGFAALRHIQELTLRVDATALPPSIAGMTALATLRVGQTHFGQNDLRALPSWLAQLPALRTLEANGNRIAKLPAELCECSALEVLDLANNPLRELPANIGTLRSLRVLELARTEVQSVPASFADLAALRSLSLPDSVIEFPKSVTFALEKFTGPAAIKQSIARRQVETTDEDELDLDDVDAIPLDLGQPWRIRLSVDPPHPLTQLATVTRLRELDLLNVTLGRVLPFVHAPIEKLTLVTNEPVPERIGAFTELTALSLHGPLDVLPESMARLQKLRVLLLAGSPIDTAPIAALSALEVVCLTSALPELPIALVRLPHLAELELRASDGWRSLAGFELLTRMPSLRTLVLPAELSDGHPLDVRALADALVRAPWIEKLHLIGWACVPDDWTPLPHLRELSLWTSRRYPVPAGLARFTGLARAQFGPAYGNYEPADLKRCLPPGRWKRGSDRSNLVFERT